MCVLHISGRNLDPDVVVGLQPYRVHRVGEARRSSQPNGPKWDTSGLSVEVSDAPWSDLDAQIADACAFLDRHASDLRNLRADDTVEDMRLDFPVSLRIGESVSVQFEFFPRSLTERAGALGLGIELSIYPPSDFE